YEVLKNSLLQCSYDTTEAISKMNVILCARSHDMFYVADLFYKESVSKLTARDSGTMAYWAAAFRNMGGRIGAIEIVSSCLDNKARCDMFIEMMIEIEELLSKAPAAPNGEYNYLADGKAMSIIDEFETRI